MGPYHAKLLTFLKWKLKKTMKLENKKRKFLSCAISFLYFHWPYLASHPFLLQGEYDSPGDDMNDRKVSLLCAVWNTMDGCGTGYKYLSLSVSSDCFSIVVLLSTFRNVGLTMAVCAVEVLLAVST